jgi:diguanylate cyclase (GGDEF)-like protein
MSQLEHLSKMSQARHQRVTELLASLTVLPTVAQVPMRIMQMHRSKTAPSFDAFAEVLIADAALSVKVLELANSAWYSRSRNVTKVSDALRMIGLNNLFPLVFGLSLAGIYNSTGLPAELRTPMWHASLLKGIFAREWALSHSPELAEEAFLCGVLQDIAVPAMLAADRSASSELFAVLELDAAGRTARETSMYGADHAAFGKSVCATMGLPELFIQSTAGHHVKAQGPHDRVLADLEPGLAMAAALPHGLARLDEAVARKCAERMIVAANRQAAGDVIGRVAASAARYMQMLTPAEPAAAGMKSFLQEVSAEIAKTLITSIGTANHAIEQLQTAQTELEGKVRALDEQVVRAEYDSLTNVLNRRGFFARAGKLITLANRLEMGCAVGFVDLNDFKQINDELGHDAGDKALTLTAEALRGMLQNRGMIARCGGDEFAFVLVVPPADRESVHAQVQRAVQHLQLDTPHGKTTVTVSFGIAWLGVPAADQSLDDALRLADEQMYQAKRRGKNARVTERPFSKSA